MANAGDLADTWTRARQPVPEFAAATVFQSQLETLNCLKQAGERIDDRTLCFQRQEDLWRAVLSEEITENGFLELDGFYLTEWVPLRPGLYHTRDARWARESALRNGRVEDTPKSLVKETEADTAFRDAGVDSWGREQMLTLLRESNGIINVYFAENVGVQGERASAGSVAFHQREKQDDE